MVLSRRVSLLKPSSTVAVMNTAAALKAQGIPVISFAAGEPDFDTPKVVKDAAIAALNAGQTKYMPTPGDAPTRKAIADKLTAENGIPNLTPDHVVISAGGKNSLYLVFQALLDAPAPGQPPWDVLLPVPAWVSYAPIAELSGGRVVELPTSPDSAFKISPAQLERAITPRSRILVLNSPSNPCGTMYSPDELRDLAAVVERAAASIAPDLCIVSDEIYEKIILGGIPHCSIGAFPGVAERTITVNGLSKAFAMTGWRVGYAAGSGPFGLQVAQALSKLQGQVTTCLPAFIYPAIRAALAHCAADVESMRQAFASRAELIASLASRLPNLPAVRPTGAFYLFPDIAAHLGTTSASGRPVRTAAEFAQALLDEQRVALVPGEDFGGPAAHHVRISFACADDDIREGMRRLGDFLRALKH